MLYTQNGDHVVAVYFVTSFHPTYCINGPETPQNCSFPGEGIRAATQCMVSTVQPSLQPKRRLVGSAACKQRSLTNRQTDTQIDHATSRAVHAMRPHNANIIYTVSQKKQDTKLLPITSPNINRFSKFFHW